MAIKSTKSKSISLPAQEITQGNVTFYLTKITAKKLNELVAINRRKPNKSKGYQRHFSPSRLKAIGRYIDQERLIPTGIIVTFDNGRYAGGRLIVPNKKASGWVIDGQHRLLGAAQAHKEIELPVIAFVGLPTRNQIDLFVTINKEAKGVPSSLYIDLLQDLPKEKTPEDISKERCANIVQLLNEDEESPFHGRFVVMTMPKKGELSLTNFARKAQHLFVPNKGLLAGYDLNTQAKIISNYFSAIEHTFSEELKQPVPVFYQTIGFGAFMNVFPTIFTHVFNETKGGFEISDIVPLLKQMEGFEFEGWRERGTGTQAENAAAKDLEAELLDIFKRRKKPQGIRV